MLQADFLGGVVEGFYGKVWTRQERLHLLSQMAALGLNTYFYAPKNDLKHRAIWRELYSDAELATFRELVQMCDQHGLRFIYGLSPGLDVRFSDESDRNRIKARFDQLLQVGVRHFALLFDDLPGSMTDADRGAYDSLAAAQCDVTNAVFAWTRARNASGRFLFCPTPYCDRMDRAQLGGAAYLDDVGRLLAPEIDVLWTGTEIVSAEIPVESIERLSGRIRRPPVIWDNLFANDYDFRRINCGPYSGRPSELRQAVRGIVINPNNEYPLNFIALHTVAAFLNGDGEWNPREAFLDAAILWLPCFATVASPLTREDLLLLCDCFYLPNTEGPEGAQLIRLVERLLAETPKTWGTAREEFSAMNARIQRLFDRLTELRDRELFDAWSRRVWELKEEMQLIEATLAQKEAGRDIVEGIALDSFLPGTFRGGILGKLTGFLSMDSQGKIRFRTTRNRE
jgi:protein O-GlcNAcase/histone acetyltransferase